MNQDNRSRSRDYIAARRSFAADRSNQDAQISNENSRAAAQAVILINGGAATAVLAFLSKEKMETHFIVFAAIAMCLYAIGVAAGACMIWCKNHALRCWSIVWQDVMKAPWIEFAAEESHQRAVKWFWWSNVAFLGSIVFFVVASGCLAWGLAKYQITLPPLML